MTIPSFEPQTFVVNAQVSYIQPTASGLVDPVKNYEWYQGQCIELEKNKIEIFKLYISVQIALASGVLGFCGFFIKEIKLLKYQWVLIISVVLIGLTMALSIWELLVSQMVFEDIFEKETDKYKERAGIPVSRKAPVRRGSNWSRHVWRFYYWLIKSVGLDNKGTFCRRLMKWSTGFGIISVIVLCIFLSLNFHSEVQSEQQAQQIPTGRLEGSHKVSAGSESNSIPPRESTGSQFSPSTDHCPIAERGGRESLQSDALHSKSGSVTKEVTR